MNNSTSTSIPNYYYTCALLLLPFLLSTATATATPLVDQTCKKTSNYALCLSSLSSDPRTASARDVKALALIELGVISAKAEVTSDHVVRLFNNTTDPWLSRSYGTCIDTFQGIVDNRVPQATAALKNPTNNYGEAKATVGVIKTDVLMCLDQYGDDDKQPFTNEAQLVGSLAGVAIGIISLLH